MLSKEFFGKCVSNNDYCFLVALLIIFAVILTSVTLNAILVLYIRKQTMEIRRLSNTYIQTSYQKRATKTVFIITILLVLSNIPQIFLLIANQVARNPNIEVFMIAHNWTRLPILINSGLNALIYIYRNQKARNMYKLKFKHIVNKLK